MQSASAPPLARLAYIVVCLHVIVMTSLKFLNHRWRGGMRLISVSERALESLCVSIFLNPNLTEVEVRATPAS